MVVLFIFFLKNNHSVYCVYTSYLTEIDLKTKEVKGITQFYGGSNYHLLNEQELFYCGIDAFDTQIRGTNYFIYNIDKNQTKRISKNKDEINKLNSLDVKNKIICCGFISENNIIKIKIDIIDKNKQSVENTFIKNNIFNKEQKIEMFEFQNNIYFFQDGIIKMSLDLNNNQIKYQTIKIFDDKNIFVSLKNNELILYTNK